MRSEITTLGPLAAHRKLLGENDALIRASNLQNGRLVTASRGAIFTSLVRHWAEHQHQALGYNRPFAVVALGGTGRAELSPRSDHDFAFLFDDALEGNEFLIELQRQVTARDGFEANYGFGLQPLPFTVDEVPTLEGKQLNSLLDMRAVYDPDGLAETFRERIRSTRDSFEHFLHVRGFWKGQWEKAAAEWERIDQFDIKNDGLRVFLAGIWTLAGKRFVHSYDIYRTLGDERDLQAYEFLLRIRSWVHSQRPVSTRSLGGGNHLEDRLGFDDFLCFGNILGKEADERTRFEFANDVRARLLSARRRVAQFTKGVIELELKDGREVGAGNPILYSTGGLWHSTSHRCTAEVDKSRAALSLLVASQRYGVPVDPSELQRTFRNAGDWLTWVPEVGALFYESRGSLADSFVFLSQLDGAEERLFPGHAKFEASLDRRVMKEQQHLRSALQREKIRAVERFVKEGRSLLADSVSPRNLTDLSRETQVPVEAAQLDAEHLAAIKLALKTKRLPLTAEDRLVRKDESRPLYERFSTGFSDIPLEEYFEPFRVFCDFTPETLRITRFLLANRRLFQDHSQMGPNDARKVAEFASRCQSENLLRALYVFTHADHVEWESEKQDPTQWWTTRELYRKAMLSKRPAVDAEGLLKTAGYSMDEQAIIRDFGEDFFAGVYRQYANRFGTHLVRIVQEGDSVSAKASVLRDGTSVMIGVAARDFRGLAACISGVLWREKIDLRQAHLFSAMNEGLALDFFHVAPGGKTLGSALTQTIEDAVRRRLFIADEDEVQLPLIPGKPVLEEWRPGKHCLRFETSEDAYGLLYALTYKVFRHLRANIFGLSAHSARGQAFVSVYLSLPDDLGFEDAQHIIRDRFG